jgi:hypothetical protein
MASIIIPSKTPVDDLRTFLEENLPADAETHRKVNALLIGLVRDVAMVQRNKCADFISYVGSGMEAMSPDHAAGLAKTTNLYFPEDLLLNPKVTP